MKSSVEKLEDNLVRLTVTRTAGEVDDFISKMYAAIARDTKLPGFRPGKAPRPIIDAQIGRDEVLGQARQALIESSGPIAIEDQGLIALRVKSDEHVPLVEHEDYTFTAEVTVRPEMKLTSVKDLKVTVPVNTPTDAEVDSEIQYLRDRYASLQVVEDRGVNPFDFVLLTFSGTVDGQGAKDLKVEKYLYEMGHGIMPPEFDQGLIGAHAGDTVHVEFAVPEDAENSEYHGKIAAFDVEVHEVKEKVLASLDDDFAGTVGGFATVAELRDDIRKALVESKAVAREKLVEREAAAAIAERLDGEVTDEVIFDRTQRMLNQFIGELEKQESSIEKFLEESGITTEKLNEDIVRQAHEAEREDMALEALYRQEGLKFTPEDMEAEIVRAAEGQGLPVEEVRERLWEGGVLPMLRQELMHQKALAWVVEHAEVVGEEPKPLVSEAKGEKTGTSKPKAAAKKAPEPKAEKPAKKTAPKKSAPKESE